MSSRHLSMKSAFRKARLLAGVLALAWLWAPWMAHAAQPAVVRLWNYNVHDKKYQQKMYKLFNERNPDIKIDYSSIAVTVYDQTLQAAFVAKDPPDLFLPAGQITFDYLKGKGLIKALNDIAPSAAALKAWMDKFPSVLRKFVEGVNVFDGKAYVVDLDGSRMYYRGAFPLYTNKALFKDAGVAKVPTTQSELRQTAAKITQAGGGKYFGISTALRNTSEWHQTMESGMAYAAGVRGTGLETSYPPDLKDGKYHHGSPEYVKLMKLWISMRADGSVFPGESTMDDETQKMLFATNKVAMQFGGWWNPGNYVAYNPDVDFDINPSVTPDDGIWHGVLYEDPGNKGGSTGGYMVSAFTKNPQAVWKVIEFISSLEYQEGYVQGGFGISYLPEADKQENFSLPQMYMMVKWLLEAPRAIIMPNLTEGARKALAMSPGTYPTFHDTMNSVYLGAVGLDALDDLDRRYGIAHAAGIVKAQEAGYKVTQSDFIFPDWDPTKDYVPKK